MVRTLRGSIVVRRCDCELGVSVVEALTLCRTRRLRCGTSLGGRRHCEGGSSGRFDGHEHRIRLDGGPLTRWRDCLGNMGHISHIFFVLDSSQRSIDALIRRRGAGLSAILEKGRVAGRGDRAGARNKTRGSWDVAILRAVVEAMIIAQTQTVARSRKDQMSRASRPISSPASLSSASPEHEIGAREGRRASPRGSTRDVKPHRRRSDATTGSPQLRPGVRPGGTEPEVKLKGQQHVMRSTLWPLSRYELGGIRDEMPPRGTSPVNDSDSHFEACVYRHSSSSRGICLLILRRMQHTSVVSYTKMVSPETQNSCPHPDYQFTPPKKPSQQPTTQDPQQQYQS